MKYLMLIAMVAANSFAAELSVTAFYRLDPRNINDPAAEVCFSVRPAPAKPQHVQVTVDPGYRFQGNYNTWVDSRGSACLVVATRAGKVSVSIPEADLITEKTL